MAPAPAAAVPEPLRRHIGLTKLKIDTRIKIKYSKFGWSIITGVPQHCKTVGEFKKHFAKIYVHGLTPIQFFVDQFCIPDEEDCEVLVLLSEHQHVRVVPDSGVSSPAPAVLPSMQKRKITSGNGFPLLPLTMSSLKNPENTSTPILKSMESDKNKSYEKHFFTATQRSPKNFVGFDELDREPEALNNSSKITPFKKPQPPNTTSESEERLTSSAKRRIRLRRALASQMNASGTPGTVGALEVLNTITPPSEDRPSITPISQKQTFGKERQRHGIFPVHPENKSDSWQNSVEEVEKSDAVPALVLRTPVQTTTRKRHSLEESANKFEKRNRSENNNNSSHPTPKDRRPDTPRAPKSIKNPAALQILKHMEFGMEKLDQNSKFKSNSGSAPEDSTPVDLSFMNRSFVHPTSPEEGDKPLSTAFYNSLPPILSVDDISENCIIAFKLVEMGENYEARTSEFKEALVTGKYGNKLTLDYLKTDSLTFIQSGKFEIEGYVSEDTQNPPAVHFSMLIDPKLVRSWPTEDNFTGPLPISL